MLIRPRMPLFGSNKEEDRLLMEIGLLSSPEDAAWYKKNLMPGKLHRTYSYESYIRMLDEVRKQIVDGAMQRITRETIVQTARIKVIC